MAQGQQVGDAAAGPIEEIVITGSRIVRRDFAAPSPILTVDSEAFDQNSSFAVEGVLNQYPQFNPGATQFNASNVTPNSGATPGVSTLNMRGLGDGRGLVLIDGRRAQPINAALSIDANMIPAAMISSVEVISGGAAATYGSDALAGVVNFRLRTDFEGIRLNYQRGVNEAGDGDEHRADILIGGNFGDGRGNAVFNVAWAKREPAHYANRDFYMRGYLDPGTESNYPRVSYPAFDATTGSGGNLPSQAAVDSVFSHLPPGTVPTNSQFYVNPADGTIFLQREALYHGYTGSTEFPYKIRSLNGTLQEIDTRRFLSSPLSRYSAFGRAIYELSDNISAFAQGTFVSSEVWANGPPTPVSSPAVPRNPGLEPEGIRILLDSRPNPDATYRLTEVAKYVENRTSFNPTDLMDLTVGLEGTVGSTDWTWEAFTTYGETQVLTNMVSFLWNDRRLLVVQAPEFGRGVEIPITGNLTLTCTSGLPIYEPYYVDENGKAIYASGFELSQDCLDAFALNMTQKNTVEQRIYETNFQGKLADVPGGELRGAFGLSWRENTSAFFPDPLYNSAVAAGGQTETAEIYGEILLPVVEQFELELGARSSDFKTAGRTTNAETYKALFNWTPTDTVRFRGGYQKAYRTPNVSELYSGPSSNPLIWTQGDPCRVDTLNEWGNVPGNPNRAQVQELCRQLMYKEGLIPGDNEFDLDPDNYPAGGAAVSTVFSVQRAGNPNLDPELAETWTAGMVWQAQNIDLTLAVDWYGIELTGAIDDLAFQTAYEQCFNFDGRTNPTYDVNNRFCEMVRRNEETGAAGQVQGLFFNLGDRYTSGIDLNVDWSRPLGSGTFGVRTALNYLQTWEGTQVPGGATLEYSDTTSENGLYKYTPFTTFSYRTDRFSIGLNWRHLPEVKHATYAEDPNTNVFPTGSYNMFNLNGGYQINDMMRLRAGIDNILDEEPRIVGANPNNNAMISTITGRYDPLGRRYYAALEVTF